MAFLTKRTLEIFSILFCVQYIFIKAESQNLLAECTEEHVLFWHPLWYLNTHWWNFALPKERDGTICRMQCPEQCICRLSNFTVAELSCINGITSLTHVTYPSNVTLLSWAHNKLQAIDQESFTGLAHSLLVLHLNNNYLHYLQPFVFSKLQRLLGLDLSHNMLTEMKSSQIFSGLSALLALDMSNSLEGIPPCAFCETENLVNLILQDNRLMEIPPHAFDGIRKLKYLSLGYNKLRHIQIQGVSGSVKYLLELTIHHNDLKEILPGELDELGRLKILDLTFNMLVELQSGIFERLENLKFLFLNYNNIKEILPGSLQGLQSLQALTLSNNSLTRLYPDTFKNVNHLNLLNLHNNNLQFLPPDIFKNLPKLGLLNLSNNHLNQLGNEIFVQSLSIIDLRGNSLLWATKDDFTLLTVSCTVFVDSAATCCFVTQATQAECISNSPWTPFLTCERLLLGFDVLRVGIWFVSSLAITSNVFCILTRLKQRRQSNKLQFLLITNLAISDFCMGIYLLILLSADLYYHDYFPSHSEVWRNGIICKAAGALSVLSSEASVFFITTISIDRALAIKFPFSVHRLGSKYARMLVSLLWLIAFAISMTSLVLPGDSDIYAVSEICVGLPISRHKFFYTNKTETDKGIFQFNIAKTTKATKTSTGSQVVMYFSIAIFICLNLLCFSVVGICYTSIFFMARNSTRKSGRSTNVNEDIKMAKKMFLLVFTDFCCWVPIAILSILVQAGIVEVEPVAYAWIATFILPINSSLNPFLYTLGDFIANKISCRRCKHGGNDTTIAIQMRRQR